MTTNEPQLVSGSDADVPAPTNPDYIRMMAIFEERAAETHALKVQAIADLSATATDEELLRDFGLDMSVLRAEVADEQES